MITQGSRVLVQSTLVPEYNGLVGEVIIVKAHPIDPTMPIQFKVRADPTPANDLLLRSIGSVYIDLDRPWEFWFIDSELRGV